jgi:tetratricopeptide (TPR) repeat protein
MHAYACISSAADFNVVHKHHCAIMMDNCIVQVVLYIIAHNYHVALSYMSLICPYCMYHTLLDVAALKYFEYCIQRFPTSGELLANYAGTLESIGRTDDAIVVYETAIQHAPESPAILNNYGWLLERQGYLEKAKQQYTAALQLLAPATHVQIETNLKNVDAKLQAQEQQQQQQQW